MNTSEMTIALILFVCFNLPLLLLLLKHISKEAVVTYLTQEVTRVQAFVVISTLVILLTI